MVPVYNRLADRPLAGWGRVGLLGWKSNSRRHHGRVPTERGGGADNSCSPPRQLKQPNGPSLTLTGAVTGFEGFEGSGHSIAVMPAPWVDRIGSRWTPSLFRRCRA